MRVRVWSPDGGRGQCLLVGSTASRHTVGPPRAPSPPPPQIRGRRLGHPADQSEWQSSGISLTVSSERAAAKSRNNVSCVLADREFQVGRARSVSCLLSVVLSSREPVLNQSSARARLGP